MLFRSVTANVPMFRVRWAKSVEKEDRYFTTMVIPPKSKTTGANVPAGRGREREKRWCEEKGLGCVGF